jgi:subtilisin family serine protease
MAAPAVSGVAALVWSYFPDLTAMELKQLLLDTAVEPKVKKVLKPGSREKVPFSSLARTGGIVNAYAAFEAAQSRNQ